MSSSESKTAPPVQLAQLPPLVLASASPRRVKLFGHLGVKFEVVPSSTEELHNEQLTARELSQLNAYRKTRSVAKRFPDSLVLGADTLVCLGNTLFGKPTDLADARRMLHQLQGREHEVVTGVCLLHLRRHRDVLFAESTAVAFRHLSLSQIEEYLKLINPLDKAGAYAIQEEGERIIREISGSYSNVVGLPLERVEAALRVWK